jgi:lysophospholipase L1-like esterase
MKIGKSEKLVMIGDSITDCGRTKPVAEGLFDPLGRGYATMVEALLGAVYPELGIRVVNMGNGGEQIRHLKARWQSDVLDLKPDWLSVYIGINDVWRQFDAPRQPELHVGLDEYEATYDELLKQTRARFKGLVLMTPHYVEPNRQDPMRVRMDQYGAVVRKMAKRHDAVLVDVQAAFDDVLKHVHPMSLAWDRIHPSQAGHMVIARAFLRAMDFQW